MYCVQWDVDPKGIYADRLLGTWIRMQRTTILSIDSQRQCDLHVLWGGIHTLLQMDTCCVGVRSYETLGLVTKDLGICQYMEPHSQLDQAQRHYE